MSCMSHQPQQGKEGWPREESSRARVCETGSMLHLQCHAFLWHVWFCCSEELTLPQLRRSGAQTSSTWKDSITLEAYISFQWLCTGYGIYTERLTIKTATYSSDHLLHHVFTVALCNATVTGIFTPVLFWVVNIFCAHHSYILTYRPVH